MALTPALLPKLALSVVKVEFSPERRKNDQRQTNTSIEERSINQKKGEKIMGKIKLSNEQELSIIADGIQAAGDSLTTSLSADKTIAEYD